MKILCRDIAQRSVEIFPRGPLQRSCQETCQKKHEMNTNFAPAKSTILKKKTPDEHKFCTSQKHRFGKKKHHMNTHFAPTRITILKKTPGKHRFCASQEHHFEKQNRQKHYVQCRKTPDQHKICSPKSLKRSRFWTVLLEHSPSQLQFQFSRYGPARRPLAPQPPISTKANPVFYISLQCIFFQLCHSTTFIFFVPLKYLCKAVQICIGETCQAFRLGHVHLKPKHFLRYCLVLFWCPLLA